MTCIIVFQQPASTAASKQSFVWGQTAVPNEPASYARFVVTTGNVSATYYSCAWQRIESARTLSGQIATLSFYARADSPKNMAVNLSQSYGSGGSPGSLNGIVGTMIPLTTTFQKYSVTVNIPPIGNKTFGTNLDDNISVCFWFSAGTDYWDLTNGLPIQSGTFDIAQVQLEAGGAATNFEQRTYAEELQLCRRYYQAITHGLAYCSAAGTLDMYVQFPVPMLGTTSTGNLSVQVSTPTAPTFAPVGGGASVTASGTPTLSSFGPLGTKISVTATGAAAGTWYCMANASPLVNISVTADLM